MIGEFNFNNFNQLVYYSSSTINSLEVNSSNSLEKKNNAFSLIPVKVYENADIDKQRLLLENDGKTGIYL